MGSLTHENHKMKKKKILIIVAHTSLFPKTMANQDRIYNMIKCLARDHQVYVTSTYRNEHELAESKKYLESVCFQFFPLLAINPTDSQIRRKFHRVNSYLHYYLRGDPHLYYYSTRSKYLSALSEIIQRISPDIVQAEYWFASKCLGFLEKSVFKVIDTHDILFDKLKQTLKQKHGNVLPFFAARELARYEELELRHLKNADLLLSISPQDEQLLRKAGVKKDLLLIPSGQDVEHFYNQRRVPKDDVILFYGSMGGRENIDGFFRLYHKIFPSIRAKNPNAKLIVVGANPPESITRLADGNTVRVTGFVDDVRPYLSEAKLMMIPLDVAAGFRSRVVDVMAMGIPVIGTHKALDCLEMENGTHGFIDDTDGVMATHAIKLLSDERLRLQMSESCIQLATNRYSNQATFGLLSDFYARLGEI
jgi:polysaccharide biosynthesis protein PslH